MRRSTVVALNACIVLNSKLPRRKKDGKVGFYFETFNHLLETYATEDIIIETDANMIGFTRLSNISRTKYSKAMWNKGTSMRQSN